MSCHKHIRSRFCTLIVPAALESSHLLSALLYLAAIHRRSIGLHQSTDQVSYLGWNTARQFRAALANRHEKEEAAAVATSLLLFLCDLFEGAMDANVYNAHLRGGGILLAESSVIAKEGIDELSATQYTEAQTPLVRFLRQWYVCMGMAAMLNGPIPESEMRRTIFLSGIEGRNCIDGFMAFTKDLVPIFAQARNLMEQRKTIESSKTNDSSVLGMLLLEAQNLVAEVKSLLEHIGDCPPRFDHDIQNSIDSETARDYALLNESHHYVALIFLYRHVQKEPLSSSKILNSVDAIVSLASSMCLRRTQASPAVALAYPLFFAGCAASIQSHRDKITHLLCEVEHCYYCGYVQSFMKSLKRQWNEEQY